MTILQHIQQLPKDIREQALDNTKNSFLYTLSCIRHVETPQEALSKAFIWEYSKEGSKYWIDVFYRLKKYSFSLN